MAAGMATFLVPHGSRFGVETVAAVISSAKSGSTAILQATAYLTARPHDRTTARRKATVSAQSTGTFTEVSIKEGEDVTASQVLARLGNSAQ